MRVEKCTQQEKIQGTNRALTAEQGAWEQTGPHQVPEGGSTSSRAGRGHKEKGLDSSGVRKPWELFPCWIGPGDSRLYAMPHPHPPTPRSQHSTAIPEGLSVSTFRRGSLRGGHQPLWPRPGYQLVQGHRKVHYPEVEPLPIAGKNAQSRGRCDSSTT